MREIFRLFRARQPSLAPRLNPRRAVDSRTAIRPYGLDDTRFIVSIPANTKSESRFVSVHDGCINTNPLSLAGCEAGRRAEVRDCRLGVILTRASQLGVRDYARSATQIPIGISHGLQDTAEPGSPLCDMSFRQGYACRVGDC